MLKLLLPSFYSVSQQSSSCKNIDLRAHHMTQEDAETRFLVMGPLLWQGTLFRRRGETIRWHHAEEETVLDIIFCEVGGSFNFCRCWSSASFERSAVNGTGVVLKQSPLGGAAHWRRGVNSNNLHILISYFIDLSVKGTLMFYLLFMINFFGRFGLLSACSHHKLGSGSSIGRFPAFTQEFTLINLH